MKEQDKEVLAVAYVLYLMGWKNEWESPDDFSDDFLGRLREKWEKYWIPSQEEEHCGDCTKVSTPCTRCHMEDYLNSARRLLGKVSEAEDANTLLRRFI